MVTDQSTQQEAGPRSTPEPSGAATADDGRLTMNLGQPFPVSPELLVAFMFRPAVLRAWLDPDARIALATDGRCLLPRADGELGPWRVSALRRGADGFEVVLRDASQGSSERTIALRVLPRSDGGRSIVKVSARHLADQDEVRASLQLWQDAFGRLRSLVGERMRGRDRPRQAVIVVHGIGEQLPGQTLRSFVNGVFPPGSGNVWVKPDRSSTLFELRRATVEGDRAKDLPTTDVYELYWAHLIRDTTFGQVASWTLGLVFSRRPRLPKALRPHLWALRLGIVVAVAAIVASLIGGPSFLPAALAAVLASVAAVAGLAWRLLRQHILLDVVGDAARYLQPKPDNIARRQAIREAGVDLIESLHDSGRYDRIVLFGHSLGSVIAYDILTFAWIRIGRSHMPQPGASSARLLRLEGSLLAGAGQGADAARASDPQAMQHDAWLEYRRNGFQWLISDFVTAGSPLTHAELLMTLDAATSFDDLKRERVLPSCPPATEPGRAHEAAPRFTYAQRYRDPTSGKDAETVLPHHAAPFAVTRWTNLYFPFSGLLRGDPIGGPVAPAFGDWIVDVPLRHPGTGVLGFAHTAYWQRDRPAAGGAGAEPHHIVALRSALALHSARELTTLAMTLPLSRGRE